MLVGLVGYLFETDAQLLGIKCPDDGLVAGRRGERAGVAVEVVDVVGQQVGEVELAVDALLAARMSHFLQRVDDRHEVKVVLSGHLENDAQHGQAVLGRGGVRDVAVFRVPVHQVKLSRQIRLLYYILLYFIYFCKLYFGQLLYFSKLHFNFLAQLL